MHEHPHPRAHPHARARAPPHIHTLLPPNPTQPTIACRSYAELKGLLQEAVEQGAAGLAPLHYPDQLVLGERRQASAAASPQVPGEGEGGHGGMSAVAGLMGSVLRQPPAGSNRPCTRRTPAGTLLCGAGGAGVCWAGLWFVGGLAHQVGCK